MSSMSEEKVIRNREMLFDYLYGEGWQYREDCKRGIPEKPAMTKAAVADKYQVRQPTAWKIIDRQLSIYKQQLASEAHE